MSVGSFKWEGNVADVVQRRLFRAAVVVENGRIAAINEIGEMDDGPWLIPGLVDAHVHVESSMLPPAEFARAAVRHGTVATVSDPHEIANVLGMDGVRFMLDDGERVPFKFAFGAPSCVPATPFETAGASLGPEEIGELLDDPRILYLAEVMNFPAVIGGDSRMLEIIEQARRRRKRIDGHAPGVLGEPLRRYARAGIETDHECTTLEEARERIALGMRVAIREGSAARNFDALLPVLREMPGACFLCSDDKHPDELAEGHIDRLLARAVEGGVAPLDALAAATINPVRHYGLQVGLLQVGDPADMVEVDNLQAFRPLRVWIDGELAAKAGKSLYPRRVSDIPNRFNALPVEPAAFAVPSQGKRVHVIHARDGQIVTGRSVEEISILQGLSVPDQERDILKLVVLNRYEANAAPAVAWVRGFNLKNAAMASSVAHDSHNIVAVGSSDELLAAAVNQVIRSRGGLAFASQGHEELLPLPIAGLMSDLPWEEVSIRYEKLTALARAAGASPAAPYMLLSFLALPVIPALKLTDKGLFDVEAFKPISPWAD